ncbi:chloramphenicol-sensitive protein RarD [Sphingobium xenophagum]|uniref:Chloramphenicol-sensitive protein RarD n=1 Tax=Sphingobium xenophagum TaxID=121428 RepID=A0ABU1X267_SPHXE|nr:EamA family transporter RarD [Sphingobium xenophagum]MDR7155272.1 chloramphenicol-sensitive protein RarD [Sphingobium xenophagum]
MLAALGAYGLWGLLPIFFRLLHHVDPVEIVTQRILWSLLLILTLLALRNGIGPMIAVLRDRRLLLALAGSAVMIAINWLVYVWAVNDGHVVATSLGYFLNPLVNVALGVLVLKERLRRGQMLAIGFAAVGVAILAASAITTLWISLTLAFSFAFYALIRKMTPVAPMTGLGVETLLLAPLAVAYLVWEASRGPIGFGQDMSITALLIIAGVVTTVPLVLFATAARSLPMATLGVLQYLAPTLQFICGVVLFGETLSLGQMLSFGLIWVGLILFATDSVKAARRNRVVTA